MQVCLVYFDGLEEPKPLLDYFRSMDAFEVSTWLVAHPQTAAHLYFAIQKHIGNHHGLVVVPLEPKLVLILSQQMTANSTALGDWLSDKQNALK